MKVETQVDALRSTVDESRRELDSAFNALEQALVDRISLGRRLAEEPWRWLLGACAVGLFLGVRK